MAALVKFSLSYISPSYPNPPLLFPARFKIFISSSTPNLTLKSHLYPLPLPISRTFHVCSSASATQEEVSVDKAEGESEEAQEEKSEETQNGNQKRKLFVLNLPWSYTVADLKLLFGECGTVADVEIIKRKNGKSRGFAFVTMSAGEEARAVIDKFDAHELLGRIIRVEFAKKLKPSPPLSPDGLRPNETRHKLYVTNLAWKVRASHLREFFAAEFKPVSTRVVFDSPSGKSAGYGFVSFASREEAESAISALHGKELMGRRVFVKFSERVADKTGNKEENTSDEQPAES